MDYVEEQVEYILYEDELVKYFDGLQDEIEDVHQLRVNLEASNFLVKFKVVGRLLIDSSR